MTRSWRLLIAGMVVLAAAAVGVVGSQLDATGTELALNDAYFVVSWGMGPFAFVTALLWSGIALARRENTRPLLVRLAGGTWVMYALIKLGAWAYAHRLAAIVMDSGESYIRVSPASALLVLGGPILAIACTLLGLACLGSYAFHVGASAERAA